MSCNYSSRKNSQEELKCYIHRFAAPFSLTNVHKLHICPQKRLFFIEKDDSSVDILKLDHKQHNLRTLPKGNVQFIWNRDSTNTFDGVIVCVSKNGCLVCYNSQAEVIFTDSIIEKLECGNIDDIELCSYHGNYLILKKKNCLAVTEMNSTGIKVLTTMPIPDHSSTYNIYQMLSTVVAILNGSSLEITLHDLTNGEVIAKLDISRLNCETDRLLSWRFTPDLNNLVIIDNTFTITTVNIKNYIDQYPGVVTRNLPLTDRFSDNEVLNTVRVGDGTWRRQLLSLHDDNTQPCNSPWYLQQKPKITKQKSKSRWRMTGFLKKNEQKPALNEEILDIEQKVYLPAVLHGMPINDIEVGSFSLSLHLQSSKENIICICDLKKQVYNVQRLPVNCIVMLSAEPHFPHLVAMETHLTCIIPCIEQEEFVSMMMSYAGATVADVLCHINKWGRCSLPLHTLEIGVKHRQLDTVVFFLKSKENLFSSTKSLLASPASPVRASPSWSETSSYHDNMLQLQPALQLLIQSVRENLNDSQSQDFVKRLSEITLEFLYGILTDALDVQESVKTKLNKTETEDITKAIDLILEDIADLRQFVRQMDRPNKQIEPRVPDLDTLGGVETSVPDLIEEAVLSNTIPVVQASLIDKGDNSSAEIDCITNTSIARAVKYLSEKQSKPAIAIFSNLGLNVNNKLWEIASFCEDKTICAFIIEELTGRKCLSPEQMEVIKFVSDLEQKYPVSSFRSAVATARQNEVPPDRLENVLQSFGDTPQYDLTRDCGELSPVDRLEGQSSGRYAHVLLDWVQRWDSETKQLILLEDDPPEISLVHVQYLLRYNKIDKLLSWIQTSNQISVMHQLLENLDQCTLYSRLRITEALARKGVFLKCEDFKRMLSQLGYVGGVLVEPHPFSSHPVEELTDFNRNFIHYCIQNKLPSLLWQYCSIHRIPYKVLKNIIQTDSSCHWVSFLSSMYRLQHKPRDYLAMFDASINSGKMIWKMDELSVGEMIKKGEILTALATSMYSSNPLQQYEVDGVHSNTELILGIQNSELELALKPYPKLHSAVFPSHTKDSIQNDVTVYQLLMDNAPFDPRKLFGWQSLNSLASDESPKVMPYFSQPDMVSKYGYVEKIRYMYYLQQGRPSFAFVSFLAEAYDIDPTGVTQQRIQDATNTALWIGVKNYSNTQITCSCVVFTEMLGQDTCLLRTYIQVGNEILSHLNATVTGTMEKKKEMTLKNENDVVSLMTACVVRRGKHAKALLAKLEDAILYNLDKSNIERTSFEAGQKWTLAVLFCHLLHIPLTTKYLELTAKADRWLPFLWFSQIHQYSKEQLQSLLYHFKSQHLQQHLHYVIENAEVKAKGSKVNERSQDSRKPGKDLRSTLYSRIGLSKDVTQERDSSDEEAEITDIQTTSSPEDTELTITDIEAISDDLFTVVFHAQSSRSPWKYLLTSGVTVYNPILIELASCLENANLITCMCGWFVSMMDSVNHDRFLENHGKSMFKWNIKHLNQLIDIYLNQNWNRTLMTGFHIFIPESTILPFLKFSAEFVDTKNHKQCRRYIQDFKEAVSLAIETDLTEDKLSIIQDSDWVQQTTFRILNHHFTHTTNLFDLLQLLKILDSESAVLLFKFDVPDFGVLSRMLSILVTNQISEVDFPKLLVSSNQDQFVTECQRITSTLINKGLFQPARDFCVAAGLSSDLVTLSEVRHRKHQLEKSSIWESATTRYKFWMKCSDIFLTHKADGIISQFYKEEAEKVTNLAEKSFLYQLCLNHLESAKDPPPHSEVYRNMWLCRIQARSENTKLTVDTESENVFSLMDHNKQQHNKKDLVCYGKIPSKLEVDTSLNLKEAKALTAIMEDLLDNGQVSECCHLSAEFKQYSQDLTIILTCIRLALGEVSIRDSMDMDMVTLVAGGPGKLHRASVSSPAMVPKSSSASLIVPMGPVSYSAFGIEMEKVVNTMETLSSHCNHGNQFCKQIINCFIISLVLTTDYESVVNSAEFIILRSLLETDFPYKVKLAGDYLTYSSLSSAEVAGFLSDSFVKFYKVKHGLIILEDKKEIIFDDSEGSVTQFIKLCPDPSLLGDRLLEGVTTLSVDQDLLSPEVLAMQTDLLILSHSCHTVACNMEGISNVLRAARAMTSCLQSTQQFTLMVQLLTGIGRFGEMTYIFDSIKQNDQFELLLKKGIEKDNSLKLAILDYLKRYHPKDKETYDMVAHNFMLHRQIAQTLEKRANTTLDSLKHKCLENIPEIQSSLQTVIQYLTDAADSYSKESCVRHAQKCIRQARLVALQLHHLSTGTRLLFLSDEEADKVISNHPKFLEALILSQSYGRKNCWPEALCNNVILNGDFRYLQEFKQHLKLTPAQIKEAAVRYQQTPNKTNSSLGNLKKLLTFCKDIEIQYQLAIEFCLKDIVTSLESGETGPYIKDIIANAV